MFEVMLDMPYQIWDIPGLRLVMFELTPGEPSADSDPLEYM